MVAVQKEKILVIVEPLSNIGIRYSFNKIQL